MRATREKSFLLKQILKGVSRSFYLTLRVVPGRVRDQLGLGYLFCRAADTIADTDLIPPSERLKYLNLFREQFRTGVTSWPAVEEIRNSLLPHHGQPAEKLLLSRLADCFRIFATFSEGDLERMRHLVATLTNGMEMDLTVFPPAGSGKLKALPTEHELDRYCYYVAGAVGEYWTRMIVAHFPSLGFWDEPRAEQLGMRFGKGLQMTNILKDLAGDLARGRCYIPQTLLAAHGLKPENLGPSLPPQRLRPFLIPFIRLTLDHLEKGWEYILAIPRREFRLRLACLWPHLFALKTLDRIWRAEDLLDPRCDVKISRYEVYGVMTLTAFMCASNNLLNRYYRRVKARIIRDSPP